jgi:hypothetical protein
VARSVTFNGFTRFTPGGLTRINAEALNQIGISAANIVGILGEAEGGAPGSVSGLVALDDPSRITELFGSGPLVDAARLAFQASADPRIPGGAAQVVLYKTNASTQSSVQVPNPLAVLVSEVAGTGSTTTVVTLATGGQTADVLIGRFVDISIASLPVVAALTTTGGTTTTAAVSGLVAGQFVGDIVQFDAATTTAALQGEYAVVIANDGTTLTFDRTLPAAVASDDLNVLPTFRREILDNAADSITVAALPAVPAAGDAIFVRPGLLELTSKPWGSSAASLTVDVSYNAASEQYVVTTGAADDFEISPLLGGSDVLQVAYTGGANAVARDTVDTPANLTATAIPLTTGGLTPDAQAGNSVRITDLATGSSEVAIISTHTAGALTLAAPGLSADFVNELQSTATVFVDILNVTSATALVTGASGLATAFTTSITGVAGDNLNIAISADQTLQSLVDAINSNANYSARVAPGANGLTTLSSQLDYGSNTSFNIQRGLENTTTGARKDLQDVIDYLVGSAEFISAARVTTDALDGGALPRESAQVNALFEDPLPLSGGTRGVSTNSSFQAGFDLMLTRTVDQVVPLIDQDLSLEGFGSTATWSSVSAQLVDHVVRARGAIGRERGAFIGRRGTKAEVLAAAAVLNDTDVQLVAQNPTVLDVSGSLVARGPRELAVVGASMRSGVQEIGEPLTFKLLRVSGISNDPSWNPGDATDAADLIRGGVLFAETVPGVGIRWVRDLTTWIRDDNLAFAEGSVRSIVRVIAKGVRNVVQDRFTGRKAAPATIAAVKDTVAAFLEDARSNNLIVDSTDPASGRTLRAYYGIRVTSSGDTVRISFSIFPVPGINFQLTDIFLQLPTQAA